MTISQPLPNHFFKTRTLRLRDWKSDWVERIYAEAYRVSGASGWNPKVVHLDEENTMIDLCFEASRGSPFYKGTSVRRISAVHSITVISYKDHSILEKLPKGTPRAVKALFRKEYRLRCLRSKEALPIIKDIDLANKAWADFVFGNQTQLRTGGHYG